VQRDLVATRAYCGAAEGAAGGYSDYQEHLSEPPVDLVQVVRLGHEVAFFPQAESLCWLRFARGEQDGDGGVLPGEPARKLKSIQAARHIDV